MKAAKSPTVAATYMVTVIGKMRSGYQGRGFANNFIAFNYRSAPIRMLNNPLSAEQGDRAIRVIMDCQVINKGMRAISWEMITAVAINQLIQINF